MNYKEVFELTQWLEKSAFTSYSLSIGGVQLSVSKQAGAHVAQLAPLAPLSMPQVAPAIETSAAVPVAHVQQTAPPVAVAPVVPKVEAAGHIVKSPIVGTFYESTSPQNPPFVKVGQAVKKGDVLCILEAMKIMNEICADADGVVAEIFTTNGQMVEARQPLFRLDV